MIINLKEYKELLFVASDNPETRTLVKIELADAAKADRIFTILMGDDVAPRREFIEQNAFAKTLGRAANFK